MKKIFILCLLLCNTFASIAQEKVEWAPLGATWHYKDRGYTRTPQNYVRMVSTKDTIINNEPARIIEQYLVTDSLEEGDLIHRTLIRQKGDSLMYFAKGKFRLLYDYSAKVGDTLKIFVQVRPYDYIQDSTMYFVVDSIDVREVDGQMRRSQELHPLEIGARGYAFQLAGWNIEGIGCLNYFFPFYVGVECDHRCPEPLRCYQDDKIFVKYSDEPCDFLIPLNLATSKNNFQSAQASPNPFTDYIEIKGFDFNNQGKSTYRIVDLSGRTIMKGDLHPEQTISTKDLQSGTYILQVKNGSHSWQKMMIKY